jgi:hypothetical protein
VKWDGIALDGMALRQRLLEGTPRIMLDDTSAKANSINIDPFQLSPGEAMEVGEAIANTLLAAHNLQPPTESGAAADVSGNWIVRVQFLHGEREHRLTLRQSGNQLTGSQQSAQFESNVTGKLVKRHVRMEFESRHEGSAIAYRFEGSVANGEMQGDVFLGSATDSHRGPVNLSQFGTGQWQASRSV